MTLELSIPLGVLIGFVIDNMAVFKENVIARDAQTHNNYRPYLASEIQELQVNKKAIQSIPAADLVRIGAKVAFRCKKMFDYFLVAKTSQSDNAR